MSRTRTRVAGAWVDLPAGTRGPIGATGPTGPSGAGGILTAYIQGLIVAGTGSMFLYNDTGSDVTIASVRVSLITPPQGGPAGGGRRFGAFAGLFASVRAGELVISRVAGSIMTRREPRRADGDARLGYGKPANSL